MNQSIYLSFDQYQTASPVFPCHVCLKLTNQFNLALNIENGSFRRICLSIHATEHYAIKYRPNPNLLKLIKGFDLILSKKPIDHIDQLFGQVKQPEKILEGLIDKMALSELAIFQLYQSLANLTTIKSVINLIESKIREIGFLLIMRSIEPEEVKSRLEIVKLAEEEFKMIIRDKKNLQITADLQQTNQYLDQLPAILRNNLVKTYVFPNDLYQLRQTNGFKKYIANLNNSN